MQINALFTAISIGQQTAAAVAPYLQVSSSLRDVIQISETAQYKIDQLQQSAQALQQAVTQSRQAVRSAALDRISSAKEYLKILLRLSPTGDQGAAHEAVRIAREVKSAAVEFKASITSGDGANVRSEMAGFAEVAGDVLKMAKSLIESYLRKRKEQLQNDNDLINDLSTAIATVREIVTDNQDRTEEG